MLKKYFRGEFMKYIFLVILGLTIASCSMLKEDMDAHLEIGLESHHQK